MILVTGAGGFLGTHLMEALSRQQVPVRALYRSRKPEGMWDSHIEWQPVDLLDVWSVAEAMKGVRQVYHCAALVSFDPKNKSALTEGNVAITANVVNAALEAGVDKLIHVSSVAALGRSKTGAEIDEDTPWEDGKNNSQYAQSKYFSELEVWRGIGEGLNAVIVNPALILGEGDWERGSAKLMKIVYEEFPWYTSGINAWVDVLDVVQAMLLLMRSDVSNQRFILSCGNFAYREIFTTMANALHRRPPHKKADKWMTEIVWRLEMLKSRLSGREATITRETAAAAQSQYYYRNEKLLSAFPEFHYRPVADTIGRMAAAFLKTA